MNDCKNGDCGCGCCEGTEVLTPRSVANRPGLEALSYRAGTHAAFLESMKARLSSKEYPALRALTTRQEDDPSIAMLDAGATMLDVLTFYQERIANEGYLRTATERRSILELARLVGYKLRPGVAASVYLAFTLENGYPTEIPAGTRAQSIPAPGELPQAFETSEPLQARAEWNELKPRMTRPQVINPIVDTTTGDITNVDTNIVYFEGTATNLKPNDPLLFVFGNGDNQQVLRLIEKVEIEAAENRSKVTLQQMGDQGISQSMRVVIDTAPAVNAIRATIEKFLDLDAFEVSVDSQSTQDVVGLLEGLSKSLDGELSLEELINILDEILRQLQEIFDLLQSNWTNLLFWVGAAIAALQAIRDNLPIDNPDSDSTDESDDSSNEKEETTLGKLGIFLDRLSEQPSRQPANAKRLTRSAETLYGAKADTLPRFLTAFNPRLKDVLYKAWANVKVRRDPTPSDPVLQNVYALRVKTAPFGHNQPLSNVIVSNIELERLVKMVALDGEYKEILHSSWVVIERMDEQPIYGKIMQVYTSTLGGIQHGYLAFFSTQAPTTTTTNEDQTTTTTSTSDPLKFQVTLIEMDSPWLKAGDSNIVVLPKTTIYAQSEELKLAEEPILAVDSSADEVILKSVDGKEVELNALYKGLESGRWAIVSGERTDIKDEIGNSIPGVFDSELVMVAGVEQGSDQDLPGDTPHTTIQFANEGLAYAYKRDTVKIYGNVVKATHGETRNEVLGSGDGSKSLQQFTLKQSPLTYTSAPTMSGIESSLEVRVNDVRWPEADGLVWLAGNERGYITKTDNEDKTSIIFGDGKHGARLPTGLENIKAVYRSGIGKPGNVAAKQISLLAIKPLGVKSVINPLPATGGADRENRDQARRNVPLAVTALDRLVSVQDYADFARTFAGIGKASAVELPDGRRMLVHVTIAGAEDIPIDTNSDLFYNLRGALRQFGDPYQPVQVSVRELMLLVISANVRIMSDYQWESVEPRIRATLLETFSFERRELGQDVMLSEVISVIQGVPGVAFVDVDIFDSVPETIQPEELENLSEIFEGPEQPNPRIPVTLAWVDSNADTLEERIRPAQLAYLSPEIPDTLILAEKTS